MGNFLAGAAGVKSTYTSGPAQTGNIYNADELAAEQRRQSEIYGQQQQLAGMLQAQAAGTGPNPAQEQYKLNVQHDIANAQGMIASQRGVNPALATRMGSNTAAAQTGEAAGKSAALQAQQQVAAEQALAGVYGQEQAGNLGQQQLYQSANTSAMQANLQNSMANQQAAMGMFGGAMSGFGSFSAVMGALNKGGEVKKYDDGGEVSGGSGSDQPPPGGGLMTATGQDPNMPVPKDSSSSSSPISDIGKALSSGGGFALPTAGLGTLGGLSGAAQGLASAAAPKGGGGGGGMESMMKLGELAAMSSGGSVSKKPKDFKQGGHVPGQAKVKGDSLKNDTVPALVSPGEIVIPRSVAKSEDPVRKSAQFVAAILAKKKHGKA